MTAQMPESLLFEGETHALCSLPLLAYFELGGDKPNFISPSTACWRGYVGEWEVVNDRLYLVGLSGWILGKGRFTGLDAVFPGFPHRVFAHWCSDVLRVPQGRRLKYEHAGFASQYERDLLLKFHRGILTETSVRVNGKADPNAPEGYSIAAYTTFASPER